MASDKRLVWELGFVPDKNGLDQVKKMLTEITNAAKEPGAEMNKELQSAATAASQLKGILHKAWNSELGQLNLNKMKDAINSTYGSVGQLKTALTQCGDAGTRAFNGFASQVLNTNLHIKKSSKLLNDMATTFSNTVRYGISSSVFNRMANEISRAYDFSVQLDKSLNDIRIVTDKSANDMAKFAVQANRAAKAMGASTRDYTEASLIYFQQGLSDEEVKARTDVTIKAANVTAQATADVSEQLTAVWNGYKVSAEEAELYIDKLAKVAADTAADLNELSVGMSKVASAANNAGVDIDQMNAMLATVVSVTREAPETIGTSFRTLFARMGDLKLGATDEDGIGLGKVSSQLDAIGVKVLDEQGNMRNMGDVIEDLAAKWQTLTQAQQQAAAVAIGGKMQYSRLIALMDNWDMYTRTLETSRNAAGELQKEQDIYMQSTEAHLQKLKTEAERTYNTLFDMDVVNGFSDSLTGLLGVFNNFLEGLGGGTDAVLFFGSTLANIFSEQIGRGIETQIENVETFMANLDAMKVKKDLIKEISMGYKAEGINVDTDAGKARVEEEADVAQRILNMKKALTDEEYQQLTTMQKQMGIDKERITQLKGYKKNIKEIFNTENISLNTLQKKSAEYKNQIKELQKQKTVGEELLSILYDDSGSSESRFDELTKILTPEAIQQLGLTKDQVDLIMNTVISGTKDVEGTANMVGAAIQQIDNELGQQVDTEQKINQAIEVRQAEESGELQRIKDRNAAQKQYLEQLEQQKARQIAIQESVKLISSLVASITAISGIIKTINDDSLSLEDKISRIVPVAIGLLTTVIPMLATLPASLVAIKGGLISIAASLEHVAVAEMTAQAAAGVLLPILLGIAVAVAAVSTAVYLVVKAWNADAEAAKDAAETAQHLEETYNSLSEAAKQLKQTISDYTDAKKSLEELDSGTEEYAKTLEETNKKAKQLIETLKLYDKYTIKNGVIEINQGVLANLQNEAQAKANRAEQTMYSAKIYSNQASLKSDKTDLSRAIGNGENMRGEYFEMYSSDVDRVVQKLKTLNDVDYDRLIHSEKQFNAWIDKTFAGSDYLNLKLQVLSEKIAKQADSFDKLIKKTDEFAKANEYYAKQVMSGAVTEKYGSQLDTLSTKTNLKGEGYVDATRKNQLTTILESYADKNAKNLETKLESIDARNNLWNRDLRKYEYEGEKLTVANDEELARTYARIVLGRDDYEDLQYKSGNNIGTLKTADGKETLIKEMSDKKMRQEIVLTLETERLKKEAEDAFNEDNILAGLKNIISSASSFGAEYGTDFSDAMVAAMASTDKQVDLSSYFKRLDPNEVAEIQGLSWEELRQKLGLTDDTINAIGADATNKLLTSFKESLATYQWDMDSQIDASMQKIQDDLEAAGKGLSKKKLEEYSKEVKVYAKNLMEVAESSDEVSESMKYDSDTAVKFALAVVRMNKAIETLAKNIDNWSDVLETSSETSQEYAEAMYGIEEALGDIYGIETKYISQEFVKEHLDEIKEASQGSEAAIESLRDELGEEIFVQILVDNKIENAEDLKQQFLTLREQLELSMSGLEIGDNLDDSALVAALNKIIEDAGMTVDQANQMFAALKLEPTYETDVVTQKQKIPRTETKHIVKEYSTDPATGLPTWTTVDEVKELPPIESDVEVPVTALRGDGKQPTITGIRKAPNSSFNNYSSKNAGGGSPGGSSKKSGGGNGSSKKSKKSTLYEKEADRYHEIDSQIKLITNDLQKLQKTQDKVFGTDLINNLNQQYSLLAKQVENYNKKLEIAKKEYDELHGSLSAAGVTFGEDGLINNYEAIIAAKVAEYNALQEQYDKLSEEEKEKWDEDEVLSKAKTAMEKVFTDMDRSDTLKTDFINTIEESARDALKEQMAINIKKFNLEIQIRLDMKDAAKDWDSFRKEVLDDWDEMWEKDSFSEGFFDADGKWNSNLIRTAKEDFDLLKTYFEDEIVSSVDNSTTIYGSGIVKAQTEHLQELIHEAQKAFDKNTDGLFQEETQTAMDNLKEYKEQAMTTAREIKQKIEDIKASYLGMLNEASDKFEEQADMLERVGKYLEHDMKLVKLIYGENQYESLDRYYQKQHENNIQQLDFAKGQVDFWKKQMELATENSDEWKYAKEQWLSAIDSANEKLETAVETAKEKWENAIDDVFDKMDRKFTGGLGLDYIKEQWSLINKNSDEYLDSINSAYGIQKLQNKYLDAIDKTDSIGNQRKLNDLMNSEIESLQQIDRLTQTDLDRAELKYQIALKEMELEEAQSNKTSMRLRRDSQGNYSYQFVANNEDIDKAKEELEDLKNQLYNFDLKAYRENLDKAATAYEEYMSKMAEAAKIVDPEERAAKEKLIQEEYLEYIGMLQEENERYRLNLIESAIDEKIQLNQLEKEDFINATDEKIDKIMNDLVPQWDSGVQQMIDKWSGPGGFKETTEDAIDELMNKDAEYRQDLDEIQRVADVDFDLIRDTIDDTRLYVLEPYIETNEDLLRTYEDQVDYIRDELIPKIQDLQGEYQELINKIKEANALQGRENQKAANTARDEREKVYNEKNPEEAKPTVIAEEEKVGSINTSSSTDEVSSSKGVHAGQIITGYTGKYYYDSYGTDPAGTRKSGKAVKIDSFSSTEYGGSQKTGSYGIHISDAETGAHLGWVKPEWLEGYASGGYTGEWGANGRLAMLHQKELVLNAEDTSNFLNALEIMRNIVGNIGSDAFARLAAIGGNRNLGEPGAGIEQNVVINADFPNATDHNEIKQAFDNLLNVATQRAYRNRM